MNKPNVVIINYDLLYEILEEIKEDLSFNIIKYESEKDFIKHENNDLINALVITNLNKSLKKRNVLNVDNFPITLNKLVQLINIGLIKLKFNYQSKVNIKGYELNLNSKFFSKNKINLRLTEKEIEIILYLDANKNMHNVLDLQKNVWGYSSELETHTVETHIYRLRKKIKDKFNDNEFIISHNEGYSLE